MAPDRGLLLPVRMNRGSGRTALILPLFKYAVLDCNRLTGVSSCGFYRSRLDRPVLLRRLLGTILVQSGKLGGDGRVRCGL